MTTARQVQVHVSGRSLKINIFRRLIANPWCSLKLFKIILCQCNLKRKKMYLLYPMYRTIYRPSWVMLSIFIQGHGSLVRLTGTGIV